MSGDQNDEAERTADESKGAEGTGGQSEAAKGTGDQNEIAAAILELAKAGKTGAQALQSLAAELGPGLKGIAEIAKTGSNGRSDRPVLPQPRHQEGSSFDVKKENEDFDCSTSAGPFRRSGNFPVNLVNLSEHVVVRYVKVNDGNWMAVESGAIPQTCGNVNWRTCWGNSTKWRFLCGVNIGESSTILIAYSNPGWPLKIARLQEPIKPDADRQDAMTLITAAAGKSSTDPPENPPTELAGSKRKGRPRPSRRG
jgi:hypothetical protein